uniref:14.7 kDa ribonuclease H-like protein n=2 Tax=Nicotiana tabacum TaxID=4097 RepID=A0A1S3Y432_TOBAC|nr:PREDICTED: 14.7 kDa ribonuclease H-like protein [Nicotiana tabacum]
MIEVFEEYRPILITRKVTWQMPYGGWYKCNTDGASKGNPGHSSIEIYVRDDACDLIHARAVEVGITTNVVAKAKAILEGLEYCVEQDLHPLILETDSLVLKKVIEGEWDPPWCLGAEVQKIKEIRNRFSMIFQHVFREGNTMADFLANMVFSFAVNLQFNNFYELPTAGRRLINKDKSQISNLRVRIAKRKAPD